MTYNNEKRERRKGEKDKIGTHLELNKNPGITNGQ